MQDFLPEELKQKEKYKITLIVPCYGRPQRTIRAIECVLNQDFEENYEAFFIGDKCPDIHNLLYSEKKQAQAYMDRAKTKGNKLSIFNLPHHYDGWGYVCRNTGIRLAKGKYTIFMDNDDVIKPNHFSNYYNAIKDTDNDFMYFNTWIDPIENAGGVRGRLREAHLERGSIGHQELIVRTEFLKRMPPEKNSYEHDWQLVKDMLSRGAKFEKSKNEPTHIIMSVGDLRETEID